MSPRRGKAFAQHHPVVLAFLVSVSLLAVPFVRQLHQQSELKHQADAIQGTQQLIQANRVAAAVGTCEALNAQARSSNGQNLFLRSLIVDGTRQGRVFEGLFRRYHSPPFAVRLRRAKAAAAALGALAIPRIKCDEYRDYLVRLSVPTRGDEGLPLGEPEFPAPSSKPRVGPRPGP